jgi:hypothetical protein
MVVPEPVAPGDPPPPAVPERFRQPQQTVPPTTNGLALTALILGLLGVVVLVISLGLGFFVAIPCSVAAWICGARARMRIDLGEATGGRGQAIAGYLLGVAGVVIGVAAAVGWIIWLANGGDLDQLQRDLERYRDSQSSGVVLTAVRALLGR